ncbi:hypothetical protein BJB45_11095 [Halomonas huangheensis]|uniref:Uncharacterized protein n=1 Tax=Halomonas huangheensis TaxID=1178482 RepID=W1N810_9GAMM|nr:hypothetical protein BJB45_11095 [Halomonas huangheensis]
MGISRYRSCLLLLSAMTPNLRVLDDTVHILVCWSDQLFHWSND